jgi:hypothetical protein
MNNRRESESLGHCDFEMDSDVIMGGLFLVFVFPFELRMKQDSGVAKCRVSGLGLCMAPRGGTRQRNKYQTRG